MVHQSDGDTNFFYSILDLLPEDPLVLYLFIISLDHLPRRSIDLIKDNSFTVKTKKEEKRSLAETITDADDTENLTLLANTPAQTESVQHSQ